jgi:CHASE2 domain-containing sensor protein
VTLKQILNNEINANIVKDRIILIGVTAPSVATAFRTPYGSGFQQEIPGVIFHAQVVSHILSAVLNGRPIIWAWPLWGDILWVWGWSVVGAVIAWRVRSLLYLVLIGGVVTSSLYGICWALFLHGAWVPLIPSAIALVLASSAIATYHSQPQKQLKTSPFPRSAK